MVEILWDQRKRDLASVRWLLRQARIARETRWRSEYVARYLNQAGELRRCVQAKNSPQ